MRKYANLIITLSVICGLFIVVCDYLVQMTTIETDYFVSRLLSLNKTIIYLSSYGCILAFPFWITGVYFVYATTRQVNQLLAFLCTACIGYSLLMLAFFHYSYAMIYNVGMSGSMNVVSIDWALMTKSNIPFYPFMFILLPASWLVVGLCNFSSKAVVSRWAIIVNPVIMTFVFSFIAWINPMAECFQPGIFSLGITAYYVICWMSLKRKNYV